MIEIKTLSHRSGGEVFAVQDVSLSIPSGEFVSIVGPSGCAKTSARHFVAGLLRVEQGCVLAHDAPPAAGRDDLADLPERDSRIPWLTIPENTGFCAVLRGKPVESGRRQAISLFETVGLKGFENQLPKTLSQGTRQRMDQARTFC